jgi:type IV pilus assembly protein PilO
MATAFSDMSKQGRWGIIGALCLALAGAFYWFSWVPTDERTTALQASITQIQLENQRTLAVAEQLEDLEVQVTDMEEQLATLSSILPEAQETDVLLRRLQAAAADSNLTLRNFDPQPAVLHDLYSEVPVQLELLGNFHDLAMFFDRVSKFGRIVTVGQVTIFAVTDGGPSTIQAQCTASTFFFLPEADLVDAEAAETTGG